VLVIIYSFQQFSVGGLNFSQYLFDECSDSMQEAKKRERKKGKEKGEG
jgi:hypothetical protein